MKSALSHPQFRKLFAAQILSLLGIGVMTVSLSLSAYEYGGIALGGAYLGGILALKMVAYVLVAPMAESLLSRRPRRAVLVSIDLLRLCLVAAMGLAQSPWAVMALAFVFFAVSSGFTPLFQSTITDLLPDKDQYARALSLSRLAYTLEAILSPIIAGLALGLVPVNALFFLASLSLGGSALLVLVTRFPPQAHVRKRPFLQRLLLGARIYLRTPRLRGLWLIQFALTLAMAWVLVNSVVYAAGRIDDAETLYTRLMACYGVGAALAALAVPALLDRIAERMLMAAGALVFATLGFSLIATPPVPVLFALWLGFGAASSLVLTPGGLVIARSAASENRPAVFAAQFALSHAGWLLAYPLAGLLGAVLSLPLTLAVLSMFCAVITLVALRVWPREDPQDQFHIHPDLPATHPHLRAHPGSAGKAHRHRYYIDDLHPHWPHLAA